MLLSCWNFFSRLIATPEQQSGSDTIMRPMSLEQMRQRQREFETPNTLQHLFFHFQGRIDRTTYCLAYLATWGIPLGCILLPNTWLLFIFSQSPSGFTIALLIIMAPCYLIIPWAVLAITIKRLHDFNFSGLWCFFGLATIFLFPVWIVVLALKKGSAGENRFGSHPMDAMRWNTG